MIQALTFREYGTVRRSTGSCKKRLPVQVCKVCLCVCTNANLVNVEKWCSTHTHNMTDILIKMTLLPVYFSSALPRPL